LRDAARVTPVLTPVLLIAGAAELAGSRYGEILLFLKEHPKRTFGFLQSSRSWTEVKGIPSPN
jgi:hypothetical protein